MKILLLGEFSGLHTNLKEGLIELGCDVDVASTGDGFKSIYGDINLKLEGNYLTKRIRGILRLFYVLKLVKKYDIVQLINPFIFYHPLIPNKLFYKKLLKNSKKFFMLAAGSDAYFWRFGRERLSYGPFDDTLKYDMKGAKRHPFESARAFSVNKFIADNCDGIIPVMYEYEISYKGHQNLLNTIPQPINTKKVYYEENIVRDKLTILHAVTRYGFKGTRHVEEAYKILREKYPDKLELIIVEKMPLEKYLNVLRKANIVIDQTNSYSWGMNALYAMAMGKVVLSGSEPEALKSLGVEVSPVINIKPNAQSIVDAVEKLIDKKEDIKRIGYESRKFVEEVHDYIRVAKKYLKTWGIK